MNDKKGKRTGSPGLLVTAAFIGPGTVTVCTLSGSAHHYQLLWVMVISIGVTIFLQEMASRLGIVSGKGLAALLQTQLTRPVARFCLLGLIFSAIVIGNAAYEAGNISGAVLGINALIPSRFGGLALGLIAGALLWTGSHKFIEKALISLVIIMSLSFVLTAIITRPDLLSVLQGMLVPSFESDQLLLILALVGTTIVPYNLFLHASLAKNHWQLADLPAAKKDTIRSVIIGGLVSISIMVTAAGVQSANIQHAGDLATVLEPLYGSVSRYLIGLGLFAAGITSAVTAPLAAAYVAQGCFQWEDRTSHPGFRATWMVILVIGTTFSSIGYKPMDVIKFAQVANGLLLPIIAGLLLWLSGKSSILGEHKNTKTTLAIGIFIIIVTLCLGIKSIWSAF